MQVGLWTCKTMKIGEELEVAHPCFWIFWNACATIFLIFRSSNKRLMPRSSYQKMKLGKSFVFKLSFSNPNNFLATVVVSSDEILNIFWTNNLFWLPTNRDFKFIFKTWQYPKWKPLMRGFQNGFIYLSSIKGSQDMYI